MTGALATTMIGITGGGIITLLAVVIRMMGLRFDRLEDKVDNNTAAIKDLEIRLVDKFTGQFKEHGERLARIEAKLEPNPPAEAA